MTEKCKQTKKAVHKSQGAAEAHLRALAQSDPGYNGVAFPCLHCFGWHVGREKKKAHKNKYAK